MGPHPRTGAKRGAGRSIVAVRGQVAPDLEIARRAAAQGGVISRDQLRGLGLSPAAIDRRAGAGALHRLHRGVYAVGHTALGPDGRRWAAVLACGTAPDSAMPARRRRST